MSCCLFVGYHRFLGRIVSQVEIGISFLLVYAHSQHTLRCHEVTELVSPITSQDVLVSGVKIFGLVLIFCWFWFSSQGRWITAGVEMSWGYFVGIANYFAECCGKWSQDIRRIDIFSFGFDLHFTDVEFNYSMRWDVMRLFCCFRKWSEDIRWFGPDFLWFISGTLNYSIRWDVMRLLGWCARIPAQDVLVIGVKIFAALMLIFFWFVWEIWGKVKGQCVKRRWHDRDPCDNILSAWHLHSYRQIGLLGLEHEKKQFC